VKGGRETAQPGDYHYLFGETQLIRVLVKYRKKENKNLRTKDTGLRGDICGTLRQRRINGTGAATEVIKEK